MSYLFDSRFPRSDEYTMTIDGKAVDVLSVRSADIACACFEGAATIEVIAKSPFEAVNVRPLSRDIKTYIDGNRVQFTMIKPSSIWIEFKGGKHLYLFASAPDKNKPSPSDPKVRFFEGGKIHDIGDLALNSGETVYIDENAVVRGCFHTSNAHDVHIRGRGIIDCTYTCENNKWSEVQFENCQNVAVEGIAIVNGRLWNLVIGECNGVRINDVRIISDKNASDGIDLCGSSDITVENTFQRTGDDCVAIKSFNGRNVKNILVQGCAFYQEGGGGPMEIGHELRCDHVENITYRNNDVLGAHGHSPIMSIHATDHAIITNILYEDIRVEHYYCKFIDIRIRDSEYARDKQRGHVQGVTFRNVKVFNQFCNPGYSLSVIGGYDSDHKVKDITFENLTIDGKKVTNGNELDLFTKEVENIVFK